jgi:hypothetical protein
MDIEAIVLLTGQALIIGASAIAIAAFVPSRRRRCPRCGYAVFAGLRCSECGHEVRSERRLHRRPRRRRRLGGAGLLAVAGLVLVIGSSITRDRWIALAPDVALILLVDDRLPAGDPVVIELFERAKASKLSAREWRLLLDRAWDGPPKLIDVSITAPPAWPAREPLLARCTDGSSAIGLAMLAFTPLEVWIAPVRPGDEATPPAWESDSPPAGVVRYLGDETDWNTVVESHVMLGPTPDAAAELEFDVVVCVRPGTGAPRALRRERITVPCAVGGAIEDHIDVDRSPSLASLLLDDLEFELNNRHLRIRAPHDLYVPRTLAAPVAIDLVRESKIVHTFACVRLVTGGVPLADMVLVLPSELRGASRPFGTAEGNDDPWTLRIRGVPLYALLDANATRCWAGEREVTLERGGGERDLSYWFPRRER